MAWPLYRCWADVANDRRELGNAGTIRRRGHAGARWRVCLQTHVVASIAGAIPAPVRSASKCCMGRQRRVPKRPGLRARARDPPAGSGMGVPPRLMHSRVCATVCVRRIKSIWKSAITCGDGNDPMQHTAIIGSHTRAAGGAPLDRDSRRFRCGS
jgi:hypothetical protein